LVFGQAKLRNIKRPSRSGWKLDFR
jgi:hypothetical protein